MTTIQRSDNVLTIIKRFKIPENIETRFIARRKTNTNNELVSDDETIEQFSKATEASCCRSSTAAYECLSPCSRETRETRRRGVSNLNLLSDDDHCSNISSLSSTVFRSPSARRCSTPRTRTSSCSDTPCRREAAGSCTLDHQQARTPFPDGGIRMSDKREMLLNLKKKMQESECRKKRAYQGSTAHFSPTPINTSPLPLASCPSSSSCPITADDSYESDIYVQSPLLMTMRSSSQLSTPCLSHDDEMSKEVEHINDLFRYLRNPKKHTSKVSKSSSASSFASTQHDGADDQ